SKFDFDYEHPAFPASLTDYERWSLSTYVYLMPFDTEGNWDSRMDRLKERVDGEDYAQTRDLYENFCASCHGIKGYGDGPLARDLVPPPKNLGDSVWMAGQSNKHLFDAIRNGKRIPSSDSEAGTFIGGMPWFGDYFDASTIGGLIDYIRSFSFEFTSPANPASVVESGSEEIAPDYNGMIWSYVRRQLTNSPAKPPEWLGNGHEH
ncbi:MAG: cytochrome c, partial [bacterium]